MHCRYCKLLKVTTDYRRSPQVTTSFCRLIEDYYRLLEVTASYCRLLEGPLAITDYHTVTGTGYWRLPHAGYRLQYGLLQVTVGRLLQVIHNLKKNTTKTI